MHPQGKKWAGDEKGKRRVVGVCGSVNVVTAKSITLSRREVKEKHHQGKGEAYSLKVCVAYCAINHYTS